MNTASLHSRSLTGLLVLVVLPAAVVPFVPFAFNTAPLKVVLNPAEYGGIFLIALPLFLGLLIPPWQVCRLAQGRGKPTWRVATWICAGASTVSTVWLCGAWCVQPEFWRSAYWLIDAPAALVLAAGGALSWWLKRNGGAESLLLVALICAHLANAVFCLAIFFGARAVGWWLTLIACIGLVAQLAAIVADTRAARRATAPDTVSTLPPASLVQS